VKKAESKKLKDAIETHRHETEGQVRRLDEVFRLLVMAPQRRANLALR
jgi:ferritin-like metal-binding protein YciE